MTFETQINSIVKDAKNKGLNFKEIVIENGLKDMIDFNKELEFARLADEFIEAFKEKTGMVGDNNISMEDFSRYIRVNCELETGIVTCNFESYIKNIHFQIFIMVDGFVTLQQIIDQTANFLTITVYHYTDEDDFDDNDPEFYVEFTSPDFRFLKQLKNTICDILRNHESKAS
nr:MAG TPA: hypothetical protein [Caudoviricetes sp.]DAT07327.1 MAG TPA: hypothetical protein [Caudoviricetes sp.]